MLSATSSRKMPTALREAFYFIAIVMIPITGFTNATEMRWKRALDSPYGGELRRCRSKWPLISKEENAEEISSCMLKLMLAAAPKMVSPGGIPELNIQQLDPLVVPNVITLGAEIFKGRMWNLTLVGTSSAWSPDAGRVTYDPSTKEATVYLESPNEISVSSDYHMEFNPGALFGQKDSQPTVTIGHFDGSANNLAAKVQVSMRKGKNGELQVKSSRGDFNIGSMKVNFQSQNPNDPITNLLNTVMSSDEVNHSILEELKPQINGIFAHTIGSLFHRGWKMLERL